MSGMCDDDNPVLRDSDLVGDTGQSAEHGEGDDDDQVQYHRRLIHPLMRVVVNEHQIYQHVGNHHTRILE